jgi:hypothetical protein
MTTRKLTYDDKVRQQEVLLPAENLWKHTDANEVKEVVNEHADAIDELYTRTVNVRDFGAKGDGVTDDTVAIQAAIVAGAGGRIILGKTHLISAPLIVSSAQTLIVGEGGHLATGTRIIGSHTTGEMIVFKNRSSGIKGVFITSTTERWNAVVGNNYLEYGTGHGVVFVRGKSESFLLHSRSIIHDVHIQRQPGIGLMLSSSMELSTIDTVTVTECGHHGIVADGGILTDQYRTVESLFHVIFNNVRSIGHRGNAIIINPDTYHQLSLSGATGAFTDINSVWKCIINGTGALENGKLLYKNAAESYVLYWDGVDRWIISTEIGGTALYTKIAATPNGTYATVGGTGTVSASRVAINARGLMWNNVQAHNSAYDTTKYIRDYQCIFNNVSGAKLDMFNSEHQNYISQGLATPQLGIFIKDSDLVEINYAHFSSLQKSIHIDTDNSSIAVSYPKIFGTNYQQPVGIDVDSSCIDFRAIIKASRVTGANIPVNRTGVNGVLVIDGVNRANEWDKEPLRLGNYRLWIDAAGKLRIKDGAPANDTDGTIVGTQS